jgi:hypothetical protein
MINILLNKIIIESPLFDLIIIYLDIKSIKNLMYTCKELYNNPANRDYTKKIFIQRFSKICYYIFNKFLVYKKLIQKMEESDYIIKYSSYINAINYYIYYPSEYINPYISTNNKMKKMIIEKYLINKKNNYTRYDLFNLLRKMPLNDMYYLGF